MLSALLTFVALLNPQPDLSNHWRWASASVNQSSVSPTPIPSPVIPSPTPAPNPVPTPIPPPNPTPILKPGDDCPNCEKGWLSTDSVAKEKCWKCNGDGICNIGDPILTGDIEDSLSNDDVLKIYIEHEEEISAIWVEGNEDRTMREAVEIWKSRQKGKDFNAQPIESNKEVSPTPTNPTTKTNELPKENKLLKDSPLLSTPKPTSDDPDSKAVCYKPIYSNDGYWIWDLEGKKWVRSAKQPPIYKQVATGHWETGSYKVKVCNGRNCHYETRYQKVWVKDSPKKVLQPSTPRTSHYPVRGSWWTGASSYRHLLTGPHAGRFNENWLKRLSYEEIQSLHSDHHEGKVKWQYVNK